MRRRLRVLHVYRRFVLDGYGGIQQFIGQLVRANRNPDLKLKVLYLSREGRPTVPTDYYGTEALSFPETFEIASNSVSISLLRNFRRLVHDTDVVHYHFPWPYGDFLHFACGVRKPSVVTYHSDVVRQRALLRLYLPLMHRFLGAVDTIVATSPDYVATSPVLERYRSKVTVIPIGIEKKSYPDEANLSSLPGLPPLDRPFFLFVGVLRYYKGLHVLLEAMRGIDAPLVIVGSGPIEHEIRAQIARLGLSNVSLLGAVSEAEKVALLRACHAVVLPSHLRAEAFGVSLLEGAMFGKPMVTADIGTGTSYINVHGETGLVVPPADAEALCLAMRRLLDQPRFAAELGANAARRYERLFTASTMAASYEAVYEQAVQSRTRAAPVPGYAQA
jgi:glycosyltransferase involved in cell wall biosynthesis